MHGAFLVPAVAAVLGTFFLAQRLSGSPLLGALLVLFTPVFLVSATTVMCDVWLLALWVSVAGYFQTQRPMTDHESFGELY